LVRRWDVADGHANYTLGLVVLHRTRLVYR
jgi:hypothetical protein